MLTYGAMQMSHKHELYPNLPQSFSVMMVCLNSDVFKFLMETEWRGLQAFSYNSQFTSYTDTFFFEKKPIDEKQKTLKSSKHFHHSFTHSSSSKLWLLETKVPLIFYATR